MRVVRNWGWGETPPHIHVLITPLPRTGAHGTCILTWFVWVLLGSGHTVRWSTRASLLTRHLWDVGCAYLEVDFLNLRLTYPCITHMFCFLSFLCCLSGKIPIYTASVGELLELSQFSWFLPALPLRSKSYLMISVSFCEIFVFFLLPSHTYHKIQ